MLVFYYLNALNLFNVANRIKTKCGCGMCLEQTPKLPPHKGALVLECCHTFL